jgi:flagellar assembly protein FliH
VVATRSSDGSGKAQWKVLSGEQAQQARQWEPPRLFGDLPSAPEVASEGAGALPSAQDVAADQAVLPTLEQIEALQQQAYEEGYSQGKREGFDFGHREALEEGRKAIVAKLARLDALLTTLDAPLKDLDDEVERELLTLVVAVVRQLVRREVRTDPAQIVGVLREAISILPVNSRNIRVLLHPEDAELVRELYAVSEGDQGWQIVEDPVVQRGGCRVLTEASQVDATLESRLHNLIAPLIGGLRSEDPEPDGA